MAFLRLFLLIFLMAVFCPPPPCGAAEDGKLLKVVVLSRHGVRSPTQSAKALSYWSQKEWPKWPVERGFLTPRGARLVTAMWENLLEKLQEYELLPKAQCPKPGSIYVRADVDERTRATAAAILQGVAPGCSFGYAVESGKVDALFHPVKAGLYQFDPISTATDILNMTRGGMEGLQEKFSGTLSLMSRIAGPPAPELCTRFAFTPNCHLEDLPNAVSVSSDGHEVRLVGSLSIASSMAEIFLLEYGEWPGVSAGWGEVNGTVLSQILPIHSTIFDIVNRAPVISWANGSSLMTEIAASLLNNHYDPRSNEAKLVVFVGHDTNIANIGALMGINWQAYGYPLNGIPPAAALFFELWEKNGKKHILIRFYTQPLKALHSSFSNDPSGANRIGERYAFAPEAANVSAPPVVGQARFTPEEFLGIVGRATAGAPLAPHSHPPFSHEQYAN